MKVQEVILRAMAKRLTWVQAAAVLGISDRQMRRWHRRYERYGYDGLFDRRRGQPSRKRVPLEVAERVLALYQEKYFDFNVRHFHVTQVGRALRELGIGMIPAYSPQARGRSERSFGTWQGRLPQELRLRGISTVEQANRFLRQSYIAEFNRRFQVAATQTGSAFLPSNGQDLHRIFSIQQERVVNRDNTVSVGNRLLQMEKTPWRGTLAGCRVTVCVHLDGTLGVYYGPHRVGRFTADGAPYTVAGKEAKAAAGKGCGKDARPASLEIPEGFPLSHSPDGSALTGQIMCYKNILTC
jgi:transposase